MPRALRTVHSWWNRRKIARWCGRTTGDVLGDLVSDPKLAALLAAQWPDYGGKPSEASFAVHAMVTGHYLDGAAYPAGGGAAIAKGLVPAIEEAGGSARAGTPVDEIVIEDGKAVGVRTRSGEEIRAPAVVSAIGARETVTRLLPDEIRKQGWAREITGFTPGICAFDLYLGFEGDIAHHGATRANHWFYDTWDPNGALWSPTEGAPIPAMFVSFGSLKNSTHEPGPSMRHTGDLVVFAEWSAVSDFAKGDARKRSSDWAAFKADIEARMMAFFAKRFPALAPLVAYQELGTPFATVAFTGHEKGGFYGLETTPRRMLSDALSARTPVPGLYLSGQDVMTPGIAGALAGGLLAAAAIEPRAIKKIR
jgi:all-trans-retinol 13,14-reductase